MPFEYQGKIYQSLQEFWADYMKHNFEMETNDEGELHFPYQSCEDADNVAEGIIKNHFYENELASEVKESDEKVKEADHVFVKQRMLWRVVNRSRDIITEFVGSEAELEKTFDPLFNHVKKESFDTFRVW